MEEKIIFDKQNMTHLSWSKIRRSSGTAGSFLKAQEEIGGQKIYYKLSDYNAALGIIGHEAVNEIIACRLLTLLKIPHVPYQLIRADVSLKGSVYETWLCASENFRNKGEQKIPLDVFYDLEKEKESPLDFCRRKGWGNYINEMLVVDFLILNRDRHGANVEVLRDPVKKEVRLAPLFDHGISLIFSCKNDLNAVKRFDVMKDLPVQCFVGTSSAYDNLKLIPKEELPVLPELKKSDRALLLDGLDRVLPEEYLDKIWQMIRKRWKYYEDFCDQR